jgi:hypothetical protein
VDPFPDSGTLAAGVEKSGNLFRENSFAHHARFEIWIVQAFAAAEMPDPPENLLFPVGEMLLQPALEKWRDRKRQPNDGVAGPLRPRFRASLQDRGHFVIR